MDDFGKRIYRYKSVSSTNDLAKALAVKGEPEGSIVLAEGQTQGRGRWGRHWISPKAEGIWLSIILRPKISPQDAGEISLMTVRAIAKTLRAYLKLEAVIKRPNDILITGKKIAGVLVEMETVKEKIKFIVVGIGLNTNLNLSDFPEELRNSVTSVKQEFSGEFSREELRKEIIKEIQFSYSVFSHKVGNAVSD